ncbi:MAG: hypothetical protein EPO21_23305 [Chloroflexota bacterium]|nr:MAG: hypothetical protein EPO21_23305 [Chloroflexota bacterium]
MSDLASSVTYRTVRSASGSRAKPEARTADPAAVRRFLALSSPGLGRIRVSQPWQQTVRSASAGLRPLWRLTLFVALVLRIEMAVIGTSRLLSGRNVRNVTDLEWSQTLPVGTDSAGMFNSAKPLIVFGGVLPVGQKGIDQAVTGIGEGDVIIYLVRHMMGAGIVLTALAVLVELAASKRTVVNNKRRAQSGRHGVPD